MMQPMTDRLQITPQGQFSLSAAAGFGFGPHGDESYDGAMRLAFAVDGGNGYAGAILRQPEADGPVGVELELRDGAATQAALDQIARVVSLDHDGAAFEQVGKTDPVIGALQKAHPGQRPVLFHSPYEAAAWAIISARRPAVQMTRVRDGLGAELGASFELEGITRNAFPQPRALLEVGDGFPGLNATKLERLRGIARAALEGELDVSLLVELGPERAYEHVQRLPGIGPFYAGLIVLRATGFADALVPVPERRGLASAARFYGLDGPLDAPGFAELAERWRPFRTWAMVLIRLSGERGTVISAERGG